MLYAKISPAAQVVKQDGPFNTTLQTADHMIVSAGYIMGASSTEFNIGYGNPVNDADGKIVSWNFLISEQLTLTKEELADWGTDDSYIINLIAQKKGLQVIEIGNVD